MKQAEQTFGRISLEQILNKYQPAIQSLEQELTRKGWAVVELPETVSSLTQSLYPRLEAFFSNKSSEEKYAHAGNTNGWSRTSHKEALRYATGTALKSDKIPEAFREDLVTLSKEFDNALERLVSAISEPIFHMQESAWKQLDFPFLRDPGENPNRFNLMDIAYYLNEAPKPQKPQKPKNPMSIERPKAERPPQNCVAHHDPGLLSLSVFQNSPGLQLFDPETNDWYDGPLGYDLGLIWAGQAAADLSSGLIKPGVHQVVYPATLGTPRMSIWAELCTSAQLFKNNKLSWNENTTKIIVSNVWGFSSGEEYVVPVENGNLAEAMRTAERLLGMPTSKIMLMPKMNEIGEVIGFN